jgi:ABC-type uncharacterized transport system substrate-binding protein
MILHPLIKLGAAVLALLVLPVTAVFAHPHVWVNAEAAILTGPNQEITGFQQKWTFDEMYSEYAVNGLDANGDGIYSEEELQPLAQTNIEALKEFEYFTFAFMGQQKLALKDPSPGYRLEYKDKLLVLYFTILLETPVTRAKFKEFSFIVYDPGMYVSLTMDKKAQVKFVSAKEMPCRARIGTRASPKDANAAQLGENIDPASNLGLQFAERVTVDCK